MDFEFAANHGVLEIAQLNFSSKRNRIFLCRLSSPSVSISDIFSHIFDTVAVLSTLVPSCLAVDFKHYRLD